MKQKVLRKWLGEAVRIIERLEDTEIVKYVKTLEDRIVCYTSRIKALEYKTSCYASLIKVLKQNRRELLIRQRETIANNKKIKDEKANLILEIKELIESKNSKFFKKKVLVADIEVILKKYKEGE